MSKFLVTLGASTVPGSIIQCSAVTTSQGYPAWRGWYHVGYHMKKRND